MRSTSRSNSISSLSSQSSDNEVETTQIFVQNVAGNTVPFTLPTTTTISTLRSLLALRTNLPQNDIRLVQGGKHLSASTTLSTLPKDSTLHLSLPLRGGMAKKPTCDYKKDSPADKCKEKIQPIIGDCGFCFGHFCSKHRLLESHNCPNLEDCKKESHERNADKLNSERTVAIKGV